MLDNNFLQGFGFTTLDKDRSIQTATDNFDRIYFIEDGDADCYFNDREYKFLPNHMYLIPSVADTYFNVKINIPISHLYFDFVSPTYRFCKSIIDLDLTKPENEIFKIYYSYIKLFFKENNIIKARFASHENIVGIYDKYLKPVEYQLSLLTYSVNQHCNITTSDNPIVSKALNYIHKNYGEKITIKDLADAAHIGESYFIKIFKKNMNQSPYSYLKSYRMNIAMGLLKTGTTVQEISEITGFDSPEAFSKSFYKHLGKRPTTYMRDENE